MSISIRRTICALAMVSCGGHSASVEAHAPPTTPAPAAPSPVDENRCLASFAKHRPHDWIEVGHVNVALDEGRPVSLSAEDTRGVTVASLPAPKSKAAAQDSMRELTCRLGGLVLVVGESAPATGGAKAAFEALAPAEADERADLTALCQEPEGVPAGATEAERHRLAFATLDERLTTKHWRAWLWDVLEQSQKLELSERETFRSGKADELRAAAAAVRLAGPCWYESALRRPQRL